MGNLIRAEFYRLRCRPHSVLGMALILLLGVAVMTASCALPPQAGNAATPVSYTHLTLPTNSRV